MWCLLSDVDITGIVDAGGDEGLLLHQQDEACANANSADDLIAQQQSQPEQDAALRSLYEEYPEQQPRGPGYGQAARPRESEPIQKQFSVKILVYTCYVLLVNCIDDTVCCC